MLMMVLHVQIVLNSRGDFRFRRDPGQHYCGGKNEKKNETVDVRTSEQKIIISM